VILPAQGFDAGRCLAIVTLAFGEIVACVPEPRAMDQGLEGHQPDWPADHSMAADGAGDLGVVDSIDAVVLPDFGGRLRVVFAIYQLASSRIGRAWMAIRERARASAMGINLVQINSAFALGASFSGFAGCVHMRLIDPFGLTSRSPSSCCR
jgi:ABC-type branched-subunit amino acid transport system permease subunit